MPFKGQRAGTRSRRPQGISDGTRLKRVCNPNDPTWDGPSSTCIIVGDPLSPYQQMEVIGPDPMETPVSDIAVIPIGGGYPGNAGTLSNTLASATAGQNGYATGNAQYLHVFLQENDGTGANNLPGNAGNAVLELWGYNYAFGAWTPLMIHTGSDDGAGNLRYGRVRLTVNTFGMSTMHVVDVSGVDRVAFVTSSGVFDQTTGNENLDDGIKIAVSTV